MLVAIIFKLWTGSGLGLLLSWLVYRHRFNRRIAFRAAAFAGLAFLTVSWIAGWAGAHSYIVNGRRMNSAPWGEDLRLRNFVVENELELSLFATAAAAVVSGIRIPRSQIADSAP